MSSNFDENTSAKVFFDSVKEDRGKYFVDYHPPVAEAAFATLALVCVEPMETAEVVRAMEDELSAWVRRYPIPVMVSAFDETGGLRRLAPLKECDHLIGWLDIDGTTMHAHWRLLGNGELPHGRWSTSRLLEVYSDIPHRTPEEIHRAVQQRVRTTRIGVAVLIVWLVVIPAAIAILGWANPWIGAATTFYSLWRAYVKWSELTGKREKSPRELEKEKEMERMRHHHYHCEANPDGFMRLKLENFERWQRDEIQKEIEELRRNSLVKPDDVS